MPWFSVILPTYNRADWLGQAIQSVLNQSFGDYELIIVDDGSTDNTKEVVKAIIDPRIKYYYQENKERSAARNAGIIQATGEYICFLDSDDIYLPWHLEVLDKTIRHLKNSPPLLFTDIDEISNLSAYLKSGNQFSIDTIRTLSPQEGFEHALLRPIGCMRWCVKNHLIKRHLFDEKFKVGEDMELFVRLTAAVNAIIHVGVTTVLYAEHPGRTVNTELTYLSNLTVLNHIFLSNPIAAEKKYLRKVCFHGNYMTLARIFSKERKRIKALSYIVKAIFVLPFSNFKEKLYIILKNIMPAL
jgi:glycosyltransferase involved in cell wall biosynthesis